MNDREKVIEELERVVNAIVDGYIHEPALAVSVIADAISMLKAQKQATEQLRGGYIENLITTAIALKLKDVSLPTNAALEMVRRLKVQGWVRQWISVKDRLPEDNRFVLVCNDDGKMMVAQYIDETCQWQYRYMAYDVDVWDDSEQGPVCWWMPLPELPNEDKKHETD